MLLPLSLLQFLLFRRLFLTTSDLTFRGTKAHEENEFKSEDRIYSSSAATSKNALQNFKNIFLDASIFTTNNHSLLIPNNYLTSLIAFKPEIDLFYSESLDRQSSIPLAVAAIATFAGTLFDTIIILLLVAKIIIALLVIAIVAIGIALGILELTLQLIKFLSYKAGMISPFIKVALYRLVRTPLFDFIRRRLLELQRKLERLGINTPYLLPLKVLAHLHKDFEYFVRHDWALGQLEETEEKVFQLQKEVALLARFMGQVLAAEYGGEYDDKAEPYRDYPHFDPMKVYEGGSEDGSEWK